jgi:fatty-acyl-CoA synthase
MTRNLSYLDVLAAHAAQSPHAIALRDPAGDLTYAQMWHAIGRVAGWLRARGIEPGDRVGTAMMPSAAHLVILFAGMSVGAIVVPFNIKLTQVELDTYQGTIDPSLVVAEPELAHLFEGARAEVLHVLSARPVGMADPLAYLSRDGDPMSAAAHAHQALDPRSPAIMFGTGGTTGAPKAAVWSHEALWFYGASCALAMEVRRTDTELYFSPFFHIALVTGLFGTLFAGGTAHVLPEFHASTVARIVCAGDVTRFFGAPTALTRVLNSAEFDPTQTGKVRRVLFGSTRSEPDLIGRLQDAFLAAEFITGYGATEFGAVVRLRSWEFSPGHDVGVGRAVPGVNVFIVDDAGQPLPAGSVGEIVIRAPWQMLGYWGQMDDPAHALVLGGVRSGDLGELDVDGNLHLRGRSKEMVITGGENVFPVEVEDALSACDEVAAVAVFGIKDADWGERVEAAVVLSGIGHPTPESLGAYCRERLASYKVPKRFHVVDQLPLTTAMKVDKRKLQELLGHA